MVIDAVQELVDLINSDWNILNTDSIKPKIDKITNIPFEQQFGDDKGYILLYSINESEEIPGTGAITRANVKETIKIDIRFGGQGDWTVSDIESRFNKYKSELKRVIYSNRIEPTTNYCILETSNKNITNLSNRSKKLFREIREITLEAYNRDMTI